MMKEQCKQCKKFDRWIYLSTVVPSQCGCERCCYDLTKPDVCIAFDPVVEEEPKTLEDAIKFHINKLGKDNGYHLVDEVCDGIINWIDSHKKQTWISVDERLPEIVNEEIPISNIVLIRCDHDSQTTRPAVYYFEDHCWLENRAGKIEIYNVTEWMELPE